MIRKAKMYRTSFNDVVSQSYLNETTFYNIQQIFPVIKKEKPWQITRQNILNLVKK